jgi:hypothetical protein
MSHLTSVYLSLHYITSGSGERRAVAVQVQGDRQCRMPVMLVPKFSKLNEPKMEISKFLDLDICFGHFVINTFSFTVKLVIS